MDRVQASPELLGGTSYRSHGYFYLELLFQLTPGSHFSVDARFPLHCEPMFFPWYWIARVVFSLLTFFPEFMGLDTLRPLITRDLHQVLATPALTMVPWQCYLVGLDCMAIQIPWSDQQQIDTCFCFRSTLSAF